VVLPPWAVLAIAAAVVILLCIGSIALIGALGGGDDQETPTPEPSATFANLATATVAQPSPTIGVPVAPTSTPTPPPPPPEEPSPTPAPEEIGPGATVTVKGTGGAGLNLRARPTTSSRLVATIKEGAKLLILEGPERADGYVWWQVQTEAGNTGWAAEKWLVLSTGE
jgi:hypothetical protein